MEDLQDGLAVASAATARPRLATVGPAAVIVALTAFIVSAISRATRSAGCWPARPY